LRIRGYGHRWLDEGTEHINGLELFFRDRDQLIEKLEALKPDGTKTCFEFEFTRKTPNSDKSRAGAQRPTSKEQGR